MSDVEAIGEADALLQAGRTGQAIGLLRGVIVDRPNLADAHELLARALRQARDLAGAENALRACLAADPRRASAAMQLAQMLTASRRAGEAIELLRPIVDTATDPALLTAYGSALKSEGRYDEAVVYYFGAHQSGSGTAEADHNLAAALGDAHRFDESLGFAQSAFSKGLDAPETWLVRGRSLKGLGRFDEAETSLRESIRRRPAYADAHAELAQLVWMRTEDVDQAAIDLDAAMRTPPLEIPLVLAKAKLMEYAIGEAAAYAYLSGVADQRGHDAQLQMAAARLALPVDADLAYRHAQKAWGVMPGAADAAAVVCQASLAVGDADQAARIAEELMRDWPSDQQAVALAAVAWRMLGDPRYFKLYDYQRLVRPTTLATPAGWPTLADYLADLANSLRALHRLRGHPVGQSLRQGVQTGQSLTRSEDPAIKAFFSAIDRPIREYMEVLSERDDVLGRRVTGGYRFTGAWSVLLRPGGHHVDHIHQLGWISSAFHVELPGAIETGHQGWLKFGEPGFPTRPALAPEHFVKPKAGDLVLFPSYMWHGTVPFEGDAPRLSIAFDVVPA